MKGDVYSNCNHHIWAQPARQTMLAQLSGSGSLYVHIRSHQDLMSLLKTSS